ncbi:hypothetical protein QOZ80_5AG0385340 [Eleusine coracana subsp. coracana]|nr:hypothetical protein QOZ80_5AG0385340 [Eleusine coracana subsp. coracana]
MESALPGLQAAAVLPLTDHLLEEILVRIGAPADLVRASAACKAFHRITTDPAFLRRYRSLHPPYHLGFVSYQSFMVAEAPRPEAPAARAVARAIDFSRDQLPDRGPRGWFRCDLRDGRELLMSAVYEGRPVLPALAVRDPLARVYTLLPPVRYQATYSPLS